MRVDVKNYHSLVFDCDGVVLDSNRIKTQAFYDAALIYGQDAAQTLKDYHVKNGGISRYKKFEYFLSEILGGQVNPDDLNQLLQRFASEVKKGLLGSKVASRLDELRDYTQHANWLIVSGGDQTELREAFVQKGLDSFFDGGIFGSPDTKELILERELGQSNIEKPALFLGDSKYDYEAARQAGLDFVFISGWTEVVDWEAWCQSNQIPHYSSLQTLIS